MIYKQSFTHTDHIEFPGTMLFATDEMNKINSAEGSSKSGSNLLEQNGGIAMGTYPCALPLWKLPGLPWEGTTPRGVMQEN